MADLSVKEKLQDIYLDLNIRRFAECYFGRSGGWLYHKFDRVDVNHNGHPDDFSEEQLLILKQGLYDFSERIRKAADQL